MSGIQMALLGGGGLTGPTVTVGSYTLTVKGASIFYYGYDGATGGAPVNFGSIANDTFNGATVKAAFSTSPTNASGQAVSYTVIFSGNRSAGFFNTLTVNGTLVSGTLGAPSYSAGSDETTFTITLGSSAATLFGTTDGVLIPIYMT